MNQKTALWDLDAILNMKEINPSLAPDPMQCAEKAIGYLRSLYRLQALPLGELPRSG